jgi:hypothetical protein
MTTLFKVGGLRIGNYSSYKHDHHASRWRSISMNWGLVEYHDNRLQRQYPPTTKLVENMATSTKEL